MLKRDLRSSYEANKREMFDGMRAYHQSEISHANHAITAILAVGGAANAAGIAILIADKPIGHTGAILWGLALSVTLLTLGIALATNIKIEADHWRYADFGQEYVRTSELLGFYDPIDDLGKEPIKTSRNIGKGNGHERTKNIIWTMASLISIISISPPLFYSVTKSPSQVIRTSVDMLTGRTNGSTAVPGSRSTLPAQASPRSSAAKPP